jgi:hypothetical protein
VSAHGSGDLDPHVAKAAKADDADLLPRPDLQCLSGE